MHPLCAVSLYVRVEGGVKVAVPPSTPRGVCAPVVRSVIKRDVVLETEKESVTQSLTRARDGDGGSLRPASPPANRMQGIRLRLA